jgi:hypothetical protein
MMTTYPLTWLLEEEAFVHGDCLRPAAVAAGHRVVNWSDEWWENSKWPVLSGPVVFHGSLGNADRIARLHLWTPGAFCRTDSFRCSNWYRDAAKWLLHERWEVLPAFQFVGEADAVFKRIGARDSIFVRPDSPLKPFSGRVLWRDQISLAALDHGFYYDDPAIGVVVAPVQGITMEWRFVVVGNEVVTGSGYIADGRLGTLARADERIWKLAVEIAEQLPPPEAAYVMDICESESGGLRLLEVNPFSGADFYACDGNEIVRKVAATLGDRAI